MGLFGIPNIEDFEKQIWGHGDNKRTRFVRVRSLPKSKGKIHITNTYYPGDHQPSGRHGSQQMRDGHAFNTHHRGGGGDWPDNMSNSSSNSSHGYPASQQRFLHQGTPMYHDPSFRQDHNRIEGYNNHDNYNTHDSYPNYPNSGGGYITGREHDEIPGVIDFGRVSSPPPPRNRSRNTTVRASQFHPGDDSLYYGGVGDDADYESDHQVPRRTSRASRAGRYREEP